MYCKSWSKCKVNKGLQRLRRDFLVCFLLLAETTLHNHQGASALAAPRPGLTHRRAHTHTHTFIPNSHMLPAHAHILTHLLTHPHTHSFQSQHLTQADPKGGQVSAPLQPGLGPAAASGPGLNGDHRSRGPGGWMRARDWPVSVTHLILTAPRGEREGHYSPPFREGN